MVYTVAKLEASSETGLEEGKFPKECPWNIHEVLPFVKQKKNKPFLKSTL